MKEQRKEAVRVGSMVETQKIVKMDQNEAIKFKIPDNSTDDGAL